MNSRGLSVCLYVCTSHNSSQLLRPLGLPLSGHVGGTTGSAYFENQGDPLRYKKLCLIGNFLWYVPTEWRGNACCPANWSIPIFRERHNVPYKTDWSVKWVWQAWLDVMKMVFTLQTMKASMVGWPRKCSMRSARRFRYVRGGPIQTHRIFKGIQIRISILGSGSWSTKRVRFWRIWPTASMYPFLCRFEVEKPFSLSLSLSLSRSFRRLSSTRRRGFASTPWGHSHMRFTHRGV